MLSSDLTLRIADNSTLVFSLNSQLASESKRLAAGSTLALPHFVVIRNQFVGATSRSLPLDRHLVQVAKTVSSTASPSGTSQVLVNITVQVPRDTAVTETNILDVISTAVNFFGDGASAFVVGSGAAVNLRKILRNES
jgi:hypothetical protein